MTKPDTPLARAARSFRQSPFQFLSSLPRKLFGRLTKQMIGPASRNGFFASLYFTFLSKRFYREHQAVLAGMAEYRGAKLVTKTSFGGFRRNVHRLEKALVMQPRRETFAENYIGETVAQFTSAIRGDSRIDPGEKTWAGDILNEYFSVVKDTPKIAVARAKFEATGYAHPEKTPLHKPYARENVIPSGIAFGDLRKLFIERRSVRWFEDRPVPNELLEDAVEAAGWAPTACNRQPYRFHAFHGSRAVDIASLAGGTAGFLHNIPSLIVVVGDMSNYVEERDRHLIYIDGSLAAMQLMLALQTLGLCSVPINWPDVDERERNMAHELRLAPYERVIMLIGIGYGTADGHIPYSQKKPVKLILRTEN